MLGERRIRCCTDPGGELCKPVVRVTIEVGFGGLKSAYVVPLSIGISKPGAMTGRWFPKSCGARAGPALHMPVGSNGDMVILFAWGKWKVG